MEEELISKIHYKKASLGDLHCFTTPLFIDTVEQFIPLMDVCEQAHEDESIVVNVMCRGGDLDIAKMVCNSLMNSKAGVTTVNRGVALSGGSMILLSGDRIEIAPYSTTMIHTAHSGRGYDVHPEHYTQVNYSDKDIRDWYHFIYKDFLTMEELDNTVLKGTPLWLNHEETGERLEKMFECRQKDMEDFYKENSPPDREELLKMTKKDILNTLLGPEEE